jgi:tripartite ATP-independent transporter DctM subunit
MTLLLVAAFALLVIGAPIAIVLAGSSALWVFFGSSVPDVVLVHRMVNGVDSFPLLAIPFFIMAGNLMNSAGITKRIFNFALALVGWMRGGLGHVNVIGSVIFAGMSGAAVADAGGLGTIEIKAMRDHGYEDDFAVGITAASATIGPIIPPSLPMVVYGYMASVSVGQLFAAGLIPGLLMAAALMVMIAVRSHRRGYARDANFSLRRLGETFLAAFFPLMTPVIIIGGMMSGLFTPTEAAVAACAYALVLGLVVYRSLDWRGLLKVSMETLETTAIILLIVAAASIFAWILTSNRVEQGLSEAILGLTDNKYLLLLLVNVLLLIIGCFLETVAAITILVPVLLPIMTKAGVDPVHFGLVMVFNLMIGLLTPPVGMVLFVLARVAKVSVERAAAAVVPFLLPLVVVLFLITYLPGLVLWLPTLIFRAGG